MNTRSCVLWSFLALAGCALPATSSWTGASLDGSVRVFDTAAAKEISLDQLLDQLSTAEVVFLGETHLDESTHRFQHAVYTGLLERRPGEVVLAMEMFQRDVQAKLSQYVAGEISEQEFRAGARPWSNYQTGYRPLIETARAQRAPVVGSNAPDMVRFRISQGGQEAFEGLSDVQKRQVAAELLDNTRDYWFRVDRAVRGHLGALLDDEATRIYSGQNLWDNTMAESCATALDDHPGSQVLHVNGGFHSSRRQGTVHQLRLRKPDCRILTVDIRSTGDLGLVDRHDAPAEQADFVVYAKKRGRGYSDGTLAVHGSRELQFRLHVPKRATMQERVPLLVWLGDQGLRAEEVLEDWKVILGEDAAVAVVEPPYPELGDDLHMGARWYWSEGFDNDMGFLGTALSPLVGYIARYQPVDPDRIVLAGQGQGGDVVVSFAVYASEFPGPVLSVGPGNLKRLKQSGLPVSNSSVTELAILTDADQQEAWEAEADQYRVVGMNVAVEPCDPGSQAARAEAWVRERLGVPTREQEIAEERTVALGVSSPLAHHYAGRLVRQAGNAGVQLTVVAADQAPADAVLLGFGWEGSGREGLWSLEDLTAGHVLPPAPGPFGGTTVLVAPAGLDQDARAALEQLEIDDVLNKVNRFAHLKVADEDQVMVALQEVLDAGRSTVLIVPAAFCAPAEVMQRLRKQVGDRADEFDLHWLPGLGGSLEWKQ